MRPVDARHAARADELQELVPASRSPRPTIRSGPSPTRGQPRRRAASSASSQTAERFVELRVGEHRAARARGCSSSRCRDLSSRSPRCGRFLDDGGREGRTRGSFELAVVDRARSRASHRARGRRRSAAKRSCHASIRSRIWSADRGRAVARGPPRSITSSTARAAACATGLPTYVPPIAESPGASMISGLAAHARRAGAPPRSTSRRVIRSGSTP